MGSITLSSHRSSAEVSLEGAYVAKLLLQGKEVVKPASDGIPTHGGIAVLIPYAGRVKNGRYRFDGKEYALPVGREGHAIHGFAKEARWEAVDYQAGSARVKTVLSGEGYPGTLEVEIRYVLGGATFSTLCAVKNVSSHVCPLVVGFHPYFLAQSWRLRATGRARRYVLADGYFPNGRSDPSDLRDIGPAAHLDDVFSVRGSVKLVDPSRVLTIRRRKMPYLVLFNGKYAEGRALAIEPYTGLPDAYNTGLGLVRLKPQGKFVCGYDVKAGSAKHP